MITPFGEIPNDRAARMSLQEQHEWLAHRVSRRAVVRGLVTGAAGMALPLLWAQSSRADESTVVRGRHLSYGSDPTTSMTVGFYVPTSFQSARVDLASPTGAGPSVRADTQGVAGSSHRYCRASFLGLVPDTSYDYSVLLDGQVKSQGSFRTSTTERRSFRFTAFGDQGTDQAARRMLTQVAALAPRLHLVAGDLCYADTSGLGGPGDTFHPAAWDWWLQQNDPVAAHMAWMTVPGNHEMEPGFGMHGYAGYLARISPGGESPIGIPVATTFQVGDVGFVGLDSNDVSHEIPANRGWTAGEQTAWLSRTLAALRAPGSGIDFVVVFMHHAPYSTNDTHASEGGIREEWVPLFDRYAVDLAISGHNHVYERTLPLRAGAVVATDSSEVNSGEVNSTRGTTYITAGGGGASSGSSRNTFIPYANKTRVSTASGPVVETEHWSLPTKTDDHAVLSVDVDPAGPTMLVRAVALDGREIDRVTLRGGRNSPAPFPAWPWVAGGSALVLAGSGAALARQRNHKGLLPVPQSHHRAEQGREQHPEAEPTDDVGQKVPPEIEPSHELDEDEDRARRGQSS